MRVLSTSVLPLEFPCIPQFVLEVRGEVSTPDIDVQLVEGFRLEAGYTREVVLAEVMVSVELRLRREGSTLEVGALEDPVSSFTVTLARVPPDGFFGLDES